MARSVRDCAKVDQLTFAFSVSLICMLHLQCRTTISELLACKQKAKASPLIGSEYWHHRC